MIFFLHIIMDYLCHSAVTLCLIFLMKYVAGVIAICLLTIAVIYYVFFSKVDRGQAKQTVIEYLSKERYNEEWQPSIYARYKYQRAKAALSPRTLNHLKGGVRQIISKSLVRMINAD